MFVLPETLALGALGSAGAAAALWRVRNRLLLSRAKHPSLAGHARIAKRIAQLLPHYEYGAQDFFDVDGAPGLLMELVRETKGTMIEEDLQWGHEKRKLKLARKYFEALGIDYRTVDDTVPNWWEKG